MLRIVAGVTRIKGPGWSFDLLSHYLNGKQAFLLFVENRKKKDIVTSFYQSIGSSCFSILNARAKAPTLESSFPICCIK